MRKANSMTDFANDAFEKSKVMGMVVNDNQLQQSWSTTKGSDTFFRFYRDLYQGLVWAVNL